MNHSFKQSVWWLGIALAAAILMITMGLRMSLGLFVQPLLNHTALNMATISLAMAIMQLMWGVGQPLSGALADRYGTRPVLLAGAILLALGCAWVAVAPTNLGVIIGFGILIAVGAGAGSFPVLVGFLSSRLPDAARGTASGIINAGGSFGQFIFAPLVQAFIAWPVIGWEGALWMLALVSLLLLPLSWRYARPISVASTTTIDNSNHSSLKTVFKQSCKNYSYILLHLSFFTCGFHIAFLVTHLPTEVSLCGLPEKVASWSLAIIGIANVLGSLVIGWCIGRFRNKYILFWMYASRALLILAYLAMPKTDLNFYLFAAGLGFTWLATVPPTAALVGKLFGLRYLATLFGLTMLSHQIGGFLGAYLGGLTIIEFGDYGWMWYADIILALLAALFNLPIQESPLSHKIQQEKIIQPGVSE